LRKRKVYCIGCANLLVLSGTESHVPLCVATAKFVNGPLRTRVDVVGAISAEKRNIINNCEHRTSISRRAWEFKKWLLWRLNSDGNSEEVKKADLQDYSVKREFDRKKEILAGPDENPVDKTVRKSTDKDNKKGSGKGDKKSTDKGSKRVFGKGSEKSLRKESENPDVLSVGGLDDHNESSSGSPVGR